jgi:hypothetical protein
MKSLKSLSLAVLAGTALSGVASAQTIIHVAGSTAFRSGATAAIVDVLSTGGKTVFAGYTGSSLLGAGASTLANGVLPTTANPNPANAATVVVECYWTGSLAGLVDLVASNNSGSYIDESNSTNATAINAGPVNTSNYSSTAAIASPVVVSHAPDMTMSDSVKTTIQKELATASFSPGTTSIGSYSSIAALAAACGSNSVVDSGTSGNASDAGFVGIVPFEWVAGNGASTTITNMSQQAADGLITHGFLPQSYLTGGSAAADTANYYYLIGRNEDSGTRIGAFSEAQFGVTNPPDQYTVSGATAALYPVTPLNTELGIYWNITGHSGYATGGNVASALGTPGGAITFSSGQAPENSGSAYFIGYLGAADAQTAINTTNKGHTLTYAGVPFTVGGVQNGQYSFWTYEHCYHLSDLTGSTLTLVNSFADQIYNLDANVNSSGAHDSLATSTTAPGIIDNTTSSVLVYRSTTEGGPISNY